MRLFVCSEIDLPSVNMRNALFDMREWTEVDSMDGVCVSESGDDVLMTIPDMHIYRDGLDDIARRFGVEPDTVVILSKHAAKSGKPALTVHPIGNYHNADFGGKDCTVVVPDPEGMTECLRLIASRNRDPGTQVCFEATHHGPYLETPTFYIEIGSDESNWGNLEAARLQAEVLCDVVPHPEYRRLVGIGGGHYVPRFTEVALGFKVNFGHMIPNYQIEGRDEEDVSRMVRMACESTGTDSVYIHKNSMKGPEYHKVLSCVESCGYETVSSKDLEPLV